VSQHRKAFPNEGAMKRLVALIPASSTGLGRG
jgi:hypothetical protein